MNSPAKPMNRRRGAKSPRQGTRGDRHPSNAVHRGAPPDEEVDWSERSVGELIDHIVAEYHEALRVELRRLITVARAVEERYAGHPRLPRGLAMHLSAMDGHLAEHIAKESVILFPLLRRCRNQAAGGPIRVLRMEHGDQVESLGRTRWLTGDFAAPDDAGADWKSLYRDLRAFEAHLIEHVRLEDEILFKTVPRP